MKVIDLLNKIANGEEIPRIQYDDIEAYIGADGYLKDNYGDNVEWWIDKNWLNKELKIIEEDKKIRKLDFVEEYIFSKRQNEMTNEDRRLLDSNFRELGIKINEIIDKLNEMEKE